MKLRIALLAVVLLSGCTAIGQPDTLEAGEEFTATFRFEGECPDGTMLQISPVTDRPKTPVNDSEVFVRFYRNEVVWDDGGTTEFPAVAGRAYDLILVRPEMDNSSTVWTATTREVVLKNIGSGVCELPPPPTEEPANSPQNTTWVSRE